MNKSDTFEHISNQEISGKENIKNKPKKTNIELSFVAVGDNLIHSQIYNSVYNNKNYDFTPIYSEIKPYIKNHDLAFINQETIIGGKSLGISSYPRFNSPESLISTIDDTGFNMVNMATNHSLDMGAIGIVNALNNFKKYPQIYTTGVYSNENDSHKLQIFSVKGVKIAFLAYTEHTNGLSSDKKYIVNYLNEQKLKDDMKKANENADIIIASMHWGDEYSFNVNSSQKHYADLFNKLGGDILIGTGPHVIQPAKIIGDKHKTLLAYSLGNFLSCQFQTNTTLEALLDCNILYNKTTDKVSFKNVKFIPLINHFEPGLTNFKVYRLKDYNQSSKHLLHLNINQLKSIVDNLINDDRINIIY